MKKNIYVFFFIFVSCLLSYFIGRNISLYNKSCNITNKNNKNNISSLSSVNYINSVNSPAPTKVFSIVISTFQNFLNKYKEIKIIVDDNSSTDNFKLDKINNYLNILYNTIEKVLTENNIILCSEILTSLQNKLKYILDLFKDPNYPNDKIKLEIFNFFNSESLTKDINKFLDCM